MLKDKLQADVKEALKSGNAAKRMTLGMILSAVKSRELDKRGRLSKTHSTGSGQADAAKLEEESKLTDEEVVEVLSSEIKKRKDSVDQFEKGGREDLAKKEKEEMAMLMEYMPEQMSEDAVREEIKKAISATGASGPKDMGKVMGTISPKIKGKFDGSRASAMVKEELR